MLVHGIVYLQHLQREARWAGCWLLWSVMGTSGCRMKACGSWTWTRGEDREAITPMPGLADRQIRICNLLAEELWVRRKQLIEPWGKPTLGGQELKIVEE